MNHPSLYLRVSGNGGISHTTQYTSLSEMQLSSYPSNALQYTYTPSEYDVDLLLAQEARNLA